MRSSRTQETTRSLRPLMSARAPAGKRRFLLFAAPRRGLVQEGAKLLRRSLRRSRLDERERRLLLHRAARLGGDRDEVVLVERVHLVAATHREHVGPLQRLALERHAELGEPRRESTTA